MSRPSRLFDNAEWTSKVFTGAWTLSHGGDAPVIEKATGEQIGRVGLADEVDVAAAAEDAAGVQPAWAATPYDERAAVIRRAADLLDEHRETFTDWLVREAGAVPGGRTEFELGLTVGMCHEAAALPSQPIGQMLPSAQPRLSLARRLPVGVVAVIAPFNVPTTLAMRSVAPALALGNAVLLKPDPRTAVVGGVLLARIFELAGLPPGVLQVLPGGPPTGEALITDRHVRLISFTGSTPAGRRVGELAGRLGKRALLELGGNSALVVLDDADLDLAAAAGAWGSFLHQGQICMTTGRHIVHESIASEYVDRLADKADRLTVGDPAREKVVLGPVIDEGQRDRIHDLVTASVDGGARVAAGGTYSGLFYRPTVLADVAPSMPAYAEEVFGPVAPVTTFGSVEEAIDLAAASDYGLSLGILTADPLRGLEVAARIPSGLVHINDQTLGDEPVVPFGGVRGSGNGARFGGAQANIEAFTETQWVTMRSSIAAYPF